MSARQRPSSLACLALGLLCCWLAALPVRGMGVLDALALVESGGNDRAVGRRGEVSRFQVLPALWPGWADPRNPDHARHVAEGLLTPRLQRFRAQVGRDPEPRELYALWNSPGRLAAVRWRYEGLPSVVRVRAERFQNLCQRVGP